MAATTASSYPDPAKAGKFPVRLAADVDGRRADLRYFTARFNHKPSQQASRKRSAVLSQSRNDNDDDNETFRVTLQDETDGAPAECTYTGRRAAQEDDATSYLLAFEPSSNSFTLHPTQADYDFNLTDTFWEHDRQALAKTYKQIPLAASSHDPAAAAASDADNGDADSDGELFGNPFNFRNYVNGVPSSSGASRPGSAAGTPRVMPAKARPAETSASASASVNTTPAKATPRPTPKAGPKSRPVAKKPVGPGSKLAKAATKAASDAPVQATASKPKIPDIHLERRASTRPAASAPQSRRHDDDEDDDNNDGFVVIGGDDDDDEDEEPSQTKRAMASGMPKAGAPISLSSLVRSASPSSAGVSPGRRVAQRAAAHDDDDDDDVFNLGEDSDDEEPAKKSDDDDVNSFSLGSPVQRVAEDERANEQRAEQQLPHGQVDLDDDDDEYDFDAAIQEALQSEGGDYDYAEQPGQSAAPVQAREDESESEEE